METIATLRDVAVIIIALLDFILLAALAVAAFIAMRLLSSGIGKVTPMLDKADDAAQAVQARTDALAGKAARAAIAASAWGAGAQRFLEVFFGGLGDRR